MSSCGGGGFRAHKASYLSWRHVQASRTGSVRSSSTRRAHARVANRERCRISFHAPASTGVPVCPVSVPAPSHVFLPVPNKSILTTRISNRWVSGYDWVTEILVWGYAPAGGRRPLFRVWGYAPTRESVISHILSHTMARRARGHGLRSLPWTFTERAPRSTWWRTSRPITSRSSRCCRRIQPAPTSSARSRIQDTGRGQPGVCT